MSLHCVVCKKELVSQQKRYCSNTCKTNYFAKQHNKIVNGLQGDDLEKYLKVHKSLIFKKNGEINFLKKQLKIIRNKIDKILMS